MKKLKVTFRVQLSGFVVRDVEVPDDFNRDNVDKRGSNENRLMNTAEDYTLDALDGRDLADAEVEIYNIEETP